VRQNDQGPTPRQNDLERYGYTLRVYLRCECGQPTEVVSKIGRDGQDRSGFYAPCCGRRYRLVGWQGGPVLKCVGWHDWSANPEQVRHIPGQTTPNAAVEETDRLLASREIKAPKAWRDERLRAREERRYRAKTG
jgi:hypothetical protein